ncbi:MAG TPA: carboxypeptidase regulatory-like domain-containing protein [Terriglobales bacterium]|nr:carboxypeptidase regulatory-like domain-containing protein [Terriglobales bacterium]
MKFRHAWLCTLAFVFVIPAMFAQDTASITGTVTDSSGAAIANAQVIVSSSEHGINREATTNGSGDYLFAALPIASYNVTVSAPGFKKYEARGIILRVGEKARADVAMQVGAESTQVTVEGTSVAQVETQSSELAGTVSGKEISQLELNGRNFTQLVTLVPGVSNQTGQDEGAVGVAGNVSYSINGGRTEYNNWELDGGDNMDNGSNTTLNVYPSLDAIGEFKVLTSNYGAQYGRSGSGTVEVETKSGTSSFHGDVYEFNRNDAYNANNYFADPTQPKPAYKKNDFGYTIGGPVFIPGVYNKDKQKTFFFWSQEWRRDRVPGQTFNVAVPSAAERTGDFSDQCPGPNCPVINGVVTPNLNTVPGFNANDPNVQALLALIPAPNAGSGANSFYNASPIQPTNWREELIRVDHNISSKERVTFRYIHDSWDTINAVPLWTNAGSFPTIQTNFKGPSVGAVARLTSTFSPTLLNEFVFSYTTDHIILNDVGAWQRPANTTFGDLFGGNGGGIIPGINLISNGAYNGGFGEDPGYIPNGVYNSNPTYTYRDNVSKILGKHNLQFGAYVVTAQKNEFGGELAAGSTPGYLTFDSTLNPNTTGNPFADLLTGTIYSFGQQDQKVKYYNRYKIVEPYFQDDFHVSNRLTLNLGLRVSMFGTYRERYHQAFNFDPAHYVPGQTVVNADGTVTGLTANGQAPSVTNLPNGIVQCGVTPGVPDSCMKGHLFNPAPRIGFAFDPKGDGKTAIRGGYGVFFEHTNGNEANSESLENSPPLATTVQQLFINGYTQIGQSSGSTSPQFPLGVVSIPTKAVWPYMQQWHFDIQREVLKNTVMTISYVGSKGTHLTRNSDLNQLYPFSGVNPYAPGEAIDTTVTDPTFNTDCTNAAQPIVNGVSLTGSAATHVGVAACGVNPDPLRPYPGYGNISHLQDAASSTYHGLQFGARRSVGGLELNFAYTYSHSIDDSSSRGDGNLVNAYNPQANRASSSFDQRHNLNFGYVWDLPFFKNPGLTNKVLGGWQYSGIMTFSTGSPFTVTYAGDNAGVANGTSTTSAYPDIIGDPNSSTTFIQGGGFQIYNPNAFTAPRGLTFGDAGRNSLRNPNRLNFDMAVFKHFAITEHVGFEFRAEAYNIFNHTELGYINGDGGSGASNSANLNSGTSELTGGNFLQVLTAHNPRILQLGAKFIF